MNLYTSRCYLIAVLFVISFVPQAWAAGLIIYETGTPDVGLAAAGFSARAQDASTLFTNPAGMTRLQGSNIMLGSQATYGSVRFDPDSNTGPQTGNDGGNAFGWAPAGSFFFTRQVGKDLAVGIGAFSYFGGEIDYNDDWVGRYHIQNAKLIGATVMPSIAFRINDAVSIGAGLNAMYGILRDEKAVGNLAPESDGQLTIKDRKWGYGADVGVLFELGEGTRIGVTYISQVNLDFKDTPGFEDIGPELAAILEATNVTSTSIDFGLKVPQIVMASVYQELGERFALMMNAGWQDWSAFKKVEPNGSMDDPGSMITKTKSEDTWHVALGGQFRPSRDWILSAGAAYDSSMWKDENRVATLPLGETWRYGLGSQYAVSEMLKVGLDYEFIWSGDLDIDRTSILGGRLSGTYKNTYYHVIALNAAFGF